MNHTGVRDDAYDFFNITSHVLMFELLPPLSGLSSDNSKQVKITTYSQVQK